MSRNQSSIVPASVVLGAMMMISSCSLLPATLFPPPPDDLPDSLEFVIASKELFRETTATPLADVDPGTVIDDLSSLSGCWGNYLGTSDATQQELQDGIDREWPFPVELPRGRLRIDSYLAMEFDPVEGHVTQWLMLDYFAGYGVIVGGTKSSYAISGADTIEGIDLQGYSSVAEDGGPNPNDGVVLENLPPGRQFTYTWRATLSGDYLRIRFATNDPPHPDDVLIFRRFECPE